MTDAWKFFQTGYNCRLIIQADSRLNGKISVKIISFDNEKLTAFMFPN